MRLREGLISTSCRGHSEKLQPAFIIFQFQENPQVHHQINKFKNPFYLSKQSYRQYEHFGTLFSPYFYNGLLTCTECF